MLARRRTRLLASGFAALALTAGLAGCGSTDDDTDVTGSQPATTPASSPKQPTASDTVEASPTPSPSPTRSVSPSVSPAVEAPEDTEEPVAPGIVGKLLTAEEVPGFNDAFTWQESDTRRREGRRPFATCAKFAMTSIGAMNVAVRSYTAADGGSGSSASNLVAEFGDEMTAKRAYAVLKSWREQCEEELQRFDRVEVGRLESVPLDGDDAVGDWYLLTYGPAPEPETGYFDAQGMTLAGSTISLVQMRLVGQDYNYRAGQEPMVAAVQEAADNIG